MVSDEWLWNDLTEKKNKQINNVLFDLFFSLFQLDDYLKREKKINMTDNTSTKNNMNNDRFKIKNIKLDENNEILHKLVIRKIAITILIILEHKYIHLVLK